MLVFAFFVQNYALNEAGYQALLFKFRVTVCMCRNEKRPKNSPFYRS